ncbi:MAG: CHASE2 domain-containing protein [Alphaproteobacteria bacterium]
MRGDGHAQEANGALRVPRRALRWAAPFTIACVLSAAGALGPIERMLIDWRFRLIGRAPTDSLVIVEIDPRSLRADKTWPWSRSRYAQAIDNLKLAGARNIGLDIDFSAQSDAGGDEAFARALERWPGEIVLARFSQGSAIDRRRSAMIETAPDARFLTSAVVASANFELDPTGLVRRGMFGAKLADGYRASMAATLAATPYGTASTFLIDYSIDAYKIRRLSFADVLANRFDPRAVAGRHVLIGASAIELGDEFVVPKYGLLPGVWLHALSYESLVQNRALVRSGPIVGFGLAFLVAFSLGRRPRRWGWTGHLQHAGVFIALLASPIAVQAVWPVSVDTGPALAAQLMCVLVGVFAELEGRTREILQQRRSIARHQSLMALVVGHSSDGVVVTDAEGRLRSCNQRAGELLDFDPPLVLGRKLAEIRPDFPVAAGNRADRGSIRSEYTVQGSGILLEVVCERVEDANAQAVPGQAEGLRLIDVYWLRDITARKRLEAAEKAALDAARESSLAKTQLIANMSHELRTPLNAVIGFADLFTRQTFGPLGNERYATYAQHIHESGHRLLAVVNDVLEVAHLDSGKVMLDAHDTDLAELARACVDHVARGPTGSGKSFRIDIPEEFPTLFVDPRLVRQALRHILSNAAKFTGPGGVIELSAHAAPGDGATIEIRDDGIGVEKQHLARLTEAFYQVDARLVRKYEGTGLGLYLVKRYMDLHQGSLAFDSEPGKGLKVRLTFPSSVLRSRLASPMNRVEAAPGKR